MIESSQRGWREETFDVRGPDFSAEPLFKMERSATPIFGIRHVRNPQRVTLNILCHIVISVSTALNILIESIFFSIFRIRGKRWKDRYNFNSYAASCGKSGLYASNESHVCPLSYGVWWVYVLPEAAEWQTKMKRESGRGQPDLTVQNSKQNNPVWKWKMDCPSHSGCHLAVPWSWASYHTSSERGHSGLSTDIEIWPIVQLIGII